MIRQSDPLHRARRSLGLFRRLVAGIAVFVVMLAAIAPSLSASTGVTAPAISSKVAAPAATCPFKVMPVGDSTTYGIGSLTGPGYRFNLNFSTTSLGLQLQYAGRLTSPAPNHEGHRGAAITSITNFVIDPAMAASQADVILLMIGTAEIEAQYPAVSANQMAGELNYLVDKILNTWGDTSIVLASIPPVSEPRTNAAAKNAIAAAYSQQVKSIAASKGSRVRYVEVYSILNKNTDLYDGLHPNEAGYRKIATAFLPHLQALNASLCEAWRFRGTTYRGPDGDTSTPVGNATLRLYGWNQNETPPGTLLETRTSDASGFFSFFVNKQNYRDNFLLQPVPPAGLALSGAWSEDGQVQSSGEVYWQKAEAEVHLNRFHFAEPTPTPTPAPTDTPTPTATLAPTDTPSPTMTPTESPTATPTESPVATATPTETPVDTATPTPTEGPTATPTSFVPMSQQVWLPLVRK